MRCVLLVKINYQLKIMCYEKRKLHYGIGWEKEHFTIR